MCLPKTSSKVREQWRLKAKWNHLTTLFNHWWSNGRWDAVIFSTIQKYNKCVQMYDWWCYTESKAESDKDKIRPKQYIHRWQALELRTKSYYLKLQIPNQASLQWSVPFQFNEYTKLLVSLPVNPSLPTHVNTEIYAHKHMYPCIHACLHTHTNFAKIFKIKYIEALHYYTINIKILLKMHQKWICIFLNKLIDTKVSNLTTNVHCFTNVCIYTGSSHSSKLKMTDEKLHGMCTNY